MSLKKSITVLGSISLFVLLLVQGISAQQKLTSLVNPFVGTGGHGHTYPGAAYPFGMVQLSPDTDVKGWDWCSGYHYSDSSIMGFSHTHLSGTGVTDYGDILFMPVTGTLKTEPGKKDAPGSGYRSRFRHETETAKPGYYSVVLDDYKVKAELTVSKRAAFHKYTFQKTDSAFVIIDLFHGIEDRALETSVKIIDNKTIQGYRRSIGWAKNHCVYFYAEFSKPFISSGIVKDGQIQKSTNLTGRDIKAFVQFAASEGEAVMIKVGISHTSQEGAKKNVKSEIPGWDFEQIVKAADTAWEKELSEIKITDDNEINKKIFYTALYHVMLNPNIFNDVDNTYMGMDKKIHKTNTSMYTVFSLWDTFRGLHPLFTIIDPKRAGDFVNSLLARYDESGILPMWELAANETGSMLGYHAVPVIYDAWAKGIKGIDPRKAFKAMKTSAMQDHLGLKYYKAMGYIPVDFENTNVSKTLEYAYDDWCIAQMAKDPAVYSENDAQYFTERAKSYINIFDPSTLLMRPKKNGKWIEPFDPYEVTGNYAEANAWQYSFFVPQDINSLIYLMGGDHKFIGKLDEMFSASTELAGRQQADITGLIGQYAHGNEPSHHIAYLFSYAGEPWKTQKWVHEALTTMYKDSVDGLAGNEDCGQMSAWYVLSSLGFYPVCPGDNNYIIGTPLFKQAVINAGGKNLTLKAENLSDKNIYIQSVTFNGKVYPYSYFKHNDLMAGGEIVFNMGAEPSKWGSEAEYRPVSKINGEFIPVPYLTSGGRLFKDSTVAAISSDTKDAVIYYSVDGSDPVKTKQVYKNPVTLKATTQLKAVAYADGKFSKVISADFTNASFDKKITLYTQYNPNYTAGGPQGLIDGIKGPANFHTDWWQGYEATDLNAVIDLGAVKPVSLISGSFLQSTSSWIFFPKEIEYYISEDGAAYTKVFDVQNSVTVKDYIADTIIKSFDKKLEGKKARYVKVIAKSINTCPDWHPAAGEKAWLFTDEITIK